ncbi:hypothetical protein SAMN05720469_15113 [Fibrobacter intestinalis]|uniref:HTH HARE-type domain-containing protein n=2 Tax=Fibrobacter TaxID=832 RepID=A0A1M6Z216_9BACT|nr:HTH domain-containing protein [Fibrobacter intestinalis]SHL24369.1 hypothetical protein SAMN05720469_15113 [Fibrobacter intestinalis]
MAYSFLNLAEDVLKTAAAKDNIYSLTHKEIWDAACKYGFDKKINSTGKTPWETIGARLYVDLRDNTSTIFAKVGEKPTKFALKENLEKWGKSNDVKVPSKTLPSYSEKDLHPLLTRFVNGLRFNCVTKTIDEKKSAKHSKGQNEWLHPDLIGVHYPFKDFEPEVLDLVKSYTSLPVRFFSFEMKKEIKWSNLKECYFQAVSNSSWANEGYLVALKYETEPEFMEEMRRLNNAFGIGFIRLDSDNIDESEILFPATTRNFVDWDTLNRLGKVNKDVKELIVHIKESVIIKNVKIAEYDKVLQDTELAKWIKEKGIG